MRRNTIGLVWLLGALLTAGVYATGPDRFLQVALGLLHHPQAGFEAVLAAFTIQAFELVCALAIGLFVVFIALGVMASRRGLRARAALAVVSVVYLALLYPAIEGFYVSTERWFGAFVLGAVGALVMTSRLITPHRSEQRNPWASHRP